MCSRREFLERTGRLAAAGACCVLLPSLLAGCGSAQSLQAAVADGKITLDRTQLPGDGFITVHADGLHGPLYVGRLGEEPYSAVLMLCTHKACVLEPAGRFLTCPCHGSEFTATGKLQKDPARTDLKSYRVTYDENHVYVYIR